MEMLVCMCKGMRMIGRTADRFYVRFFRMHIVIDMDNTLTDDHGSTTRPGIVEFLQRLRGEGHTLTLWTNSATERAKGILGTHGLHRFFDRFVFREDYDPQNTGASKDIRKIQGDVLIDDDPQEVRYVKSVGRRGILIRSFRKGGKLEAGELEEVYRQIHERKSRWKFW